jgi:hypothetical protein
MMVTLVQRMMRMLNNDQELKADTRSLVVEVERRPTRYH